MCPRSHCQWPVQLALEPGANSSRFLAPGPAPALCGVIGMSFFECWSHRGAGSVFQMHLPLESRVADSVSQERCQETPALGSPPRRAAQAPLQSLRRATLRWPLLPPAAGDDGGRPCPETWRIGRLKTGTKSSEGSKKPMTMLLMTRGEPRPGWRAQGSLGRDTWGRAGGPSALGTS